MSLSVFVLIDTVHMAKDDSGFPGCQILFATGTLPSLGCLAFHH